MYDILGKLNGLTPKQETPKPAQPLYESVEARGSIVAGVKSVEQRLREQFQATKEDMSRAAKGYEKYSKKGMEALAKAGKAGASKKELDAIRNKYDRYNEEVAEERETLKTKSGTIYKGGTYGNADYDSEAGGTSNALKPKRGRPAAGEVRAPKVAKVKGPKGRPKKNTTGPTGGSSPKGDIFGRTTGNVPQGKKGTVVKGKGNIDTVDESQINELSPELLKRASDAAGMKWAHADDRRDAKASEKYSAQNDKFHSAMRKKQKQKDMEESSNPFASFKKQAKGAGLLRSKTRTKAMESSRRLAKMLIEGVNFTEMIKKKDMTLQEMLAELQSDIQSFKETGHCSELLRDCMEVHSYGKSQLNDATENPMDNDNFPTPLAPAQPSMMDRAKRMGGHVLNKLGHGSDEDMKADLRRKMGMQEAAELNELARLAGLTVKEGNDGNLANNAKPYDAVTQGDVIAGRLGKDAMGGKAEVDESDDSGDDGNIHMADILRGIAQKFAQKAHQGDGEDSQFWTKEAGIVMKASHTIDQQGMEAGMQVLNTCDCWDALGDELELHDIDVQDLVDQYSLDQHAAGGNYRNYGSDYDGANEDPHGWDDEMEEGAGVMHFKAQQAKADGKDSFQLGDEEFPVQEGETCPTCKSEPCACEDTEAADQELAKLKENCGIVSPIGSMAQDMQQQQGKLSINTTQSSDGTKNINISADGEAADQLMQILKMAGMAGGQAHAQQAEIVIAHEAKQYGNTDVEATEEYLNSPHEKVSGMHQSPTTGMAGGTDDLNKSKDQDPDTANKAANPKAKQEKQLEDVNPLNGLGAKLMAEYQAIKLTK
jgi:hypothetical protein